MRGLLLHGILVVVPLVVVPWAVTFDAAKALLLALGALGLLALALRRPGGGTGPLRLDFRWSAVTIAAATAWAALAASAFRGPDPWAAAALLALLLAAGIVLLAFENILLEPVEVVPYATTVAAVLAIVSGYGLLQSLGVDFPFPWRAGGRRDPVSTLGNPNWAAEFAAAALPFAALAAARTAGKARGVAVLAILLALGLLAVARGRAGLLGLACGAAAGAAVLLIGAESAARRAAGWAVGGAAVGALALGAAWIDGRDGALPEALGRSDTVAIRLDLARGTARMLEDHPLGVGAGNWEAAHPPYRTEREYRLSLFRDPGEAHCEPLQLSAEGGWPVAAALLALGLALAFAAVRGARSGDRAVAAALAASLAAAAGASLASAPFHRPASLLLAAAAAGMLASVAGGRTVVLETAGMLAVRVVAVLALAGAAVLGLRAAAEGPHADGRAILRESSPLPPERAAAARASLERAVLFDPGGVAARALAGEVALRTSAVLPEAEARANREAARAHFEEVLRLRPSDPLIRSNLAHALAALGEDGPAEEAWRGALTIAPWHRNALSGLGLFLARRGRAGEALPLLDRALATDPVHAPALAARVETLLALGKEADALAAASDAADRLLADPPRDLDGAAEVARRAAASSEIFAEMLGAKAVRLLGGPDPDGGRALGTGTAMGRPSPALLDRLARAFTGAKFPDEALHYRLEARFLAAEQALANMDRDAAAEEVLRAVALPLSTEMGRGIRLRAAGVLVRAGRREAALGEIGWSVDRGFADPAFLDADPALAPIRDDPAFRGLVERAKRNARRAEK